MRLVRRGCRKRTISERQIDVCCRAGSASRKTHTEQQVLVCCLLELLNIEGFFKCPPKTKEVTKRKSRMAFKFSVETFIYRREWNKTQAFLRLRV